MKTSLLLFRPHAADRRALALAALVCRPGLRPAAAAPRRACAGGGWHGGRRLARRRPLPRRLSRLLLRRLSGYYWPGAFWGGVGLGIGIGAVGYYGGYYGGYYRGYYAPYYAPLRTTTRRSSASPVYSTAEPGAPRAGQPVPQAAAPAEPIFYPRNGQSAEATESDRRECNRWATTQRGAMDDASIFQRATFACMEGRGYTVR